MKTDKKEAKVLVAVPSQSTWEADFGMSLVALVASSVNPPANYDELSLGVDNTKGSILPQIRERLVLKALEMEATHILFLDSDMVFPNWTLHRLLEAAKPVVAANCVTKTLPPSPTARFKDGRFGKPVIHADYQMDDDPEYVEVWRVGTGVMLIEMEVFKKLPRPWFPVTFDQESREIIGEDWGFCAKCEEAGIPIYVDTLLSHTIGHVGRLEYRPEMIQVSAK